MQWSDIPWQPASRSLRQFAGLWILFWGGLAFRELWEERTLNAAILAGIGLSLGLVGLAWPQGLRFLYVGWIVLVFPLGWLVLNGFLALVFFGLLTPLGFLFRLRGRNALDLKPPAAQDSYWQVKPSSPVGNYYRTF